MDTGCDLDGGPEIGDDVSWMERPAPLPVLVAPGLFQSRVRVGERQRGRMFRQLDREPDRLPPRQVNDQRDIAAGSPEGDVALAEHHRPGQVLLGDRLGEQVHQLPPESEPAVGEPKFGGVTAPVPFLSSDELDGRLVIGLDLVLVEDLDERGQFCGSDPLRRVGGAASAEAHAVVPEHVHRVALVVRAFPAELSTWLAVGAEHAVGVV
jgi:hypothetical protein